MFNSVSWSRYLLIVGIFFGVYYVFILLLYYRRNLFISIQWMIDKNKWLWPATFKQTDFSENRTKTQLPGTPGLVDELADVFSHAERLHYPREEIVMALQLKLRNYPPVTDIQIRESVISYIRSACLLRCNIELEGAELSQLW